MWPNPQFVADLVTFTEESRNGKLYFLCSDHEIMGRLQKKITTTSSVEQMETFTRAELQLLSSHKYRIVQISLNQAQTAYYTGRLQ